MEPKPAPQAAPPPGEREIVSVLLVEDNAADARMVEVTLTESARVHFRIERADRLTSALGRIAKDTFDLILLDLSLPDAWGLDTFVRVQDASPHTPIIVLTGLDDETLGIMAVQQGAQEYLVKGQASGPLLVRSVRYALQRHRLQEDLRGLALTDDLTGLFNRRGFTLLARQLLKLCARMSRPLVLLFADLENLPAINTSGGAAAGDEALRQVGTMLRRTFRDSDVLARLGGGAFTVLAIDTPDERGISARLEETLKDFNALRGRSEARLALNIGALRFAPEAAVSIEDLMLQADRLRTRETRVQETPKPNP
jgi:diguanylate cyclase (GGDEF)-like protein